MAVLERDEGHTSAMEGAVASLRLPVKLLLGLWKCNHGKGAFLHVCHRQRITAGL